VVDFADQFIRMEAENARLREVAKSSAEQLERANKLANRGSSISRELEERPGSAEGKDEGGGAAED
jgi:hypothetical protein